MAKEKGKEKKKGKKKKTKEKTKEFEIKENASQEAVTDTIQLSKVHKGFDR